MNRLAFVAACVALVTSTGCGNKQAGTAPAAEATPQSGTSAAARSRNGNTITAAELSEAGAQNLYQAVQILRPQWLRARPRTSMGAAGSRSGGASSADVTIVYLDQNRYGGLTALQQLTMGGVTEIRFYDGLEATNRFGSGHTAGAIVVRTSKQ